jgi:hypothetical protein
VSAVQFRPQPPLFTPKIGAEINFPSFLSNSPKLHGLLLAYFRQTYFVDNVTTSGNTLEAARLESIRG